MHVPIEESGILHFTCFCPPPLNGWSRYVIEHQNHNTTQKKIKRTRNNKKERKKKKKKEVLLGFINIVMVSSSVPSSHNIIPQYVHIEKLIKWDFCFVVVLAIYSRINFIGSN